MTLMVMQSMTLTFLKRRRPWSLGGHTVNKGTCLFLKTNVFFTHCRHKFVFGSFINYNINDEVHESAFIHDCTYVPVVYLWSHACMTCACMMHISHASTFIAIKLNFVHHNYACMHAVGQNVYQVWQLPEVCSFLYCIPL